MRTPKVWDLLVQGASGAEARRGLAGGALDEGIRLRIVACASGTL
jgi:hypothetical protein